MRSSFIMNVFNRLLHKMTAKYSSYDIAMFFIEKANKILDEDFGYAEGITHLKLQKMLYFAQATFLANGYGPVFGEKIYAYKYGPVIKEIFEHLKELRANNLQKEDIKEKTNEIDGKTKDILSFVWDYFGRFSASKLVEMSHQHDPRINTPQSQEITIDKIKSFYEGRITL